MLRYNTETIACGDHFVAGVVSPSCDSVATSDIYSLAEARILSVGRGIAPGRLVTFVRPKVTKSRLGGFNSPLRTPVMFCLCYAHASWFCLPRCGAS